MTPTPKECHTVLARLINLYDKHGLRTGFADQYTWHEVQDTMKEARGLERRLRKAINGDFDDIWNG